MPNGDEAQRGDDGDLSPNLRRLLEQWAEVTNAGNRADLAPVDGTALAKETTTAADVAQVVSNRDDDQNYRWRGLYAGAFLLLLVGQIGFMAYVLYQIGYGHFPSLDAVTVRYYVLGTLAEIVGLVQIAARRLFGSSGTAGGRGRESIDRLSAPTKLHLFPAARRWYRTYGDRHPNWAKYIHG